MKNSFKKGLLFLVLLLIMGSNSVDIASASEVLDYEVGVNNLNNTSENSAVIGSQLVKPEIGWNRYDSTNSAKIVGGPDTPLIQDHISYYKGSSAFYRVNNTVTFTMNGTKFRIIAAIFDSRSTSLEVSIDGDIVDVYSANISALNKNQLQRLVYEKNNLSPGTHVVEIKSLDKLRIFEIDAIDVDGKLLAPGEIPSDIEAITLDKNSLELLEGTNDKLNAIISAENATNTKVIWTSSDESIATVDQNGNVTALKEGVVTVTAQVENTNLSANCIVTVKKQSGTESESIKLDKNNFELLEGSKDKLTATVLPENSINKNVVWSSSDESIAIVDQDGNVTAIREGTAIITAKIENTDIAATSTVIVKKPISESSSAILSITLVNGITKEYDVTNTVLNNYLNWFESAQGTSTFKFIKTISPYKKVTEYIVHDKIASFEVREY